MAMKKKKIFSTVVLALLVHYSSVHARMQTPTIIPLRDQLLVNENFTFKADSAGEVITSYIWKMGDGAILSGPSVTHNYTRPGTYIVELAMQTGSNTYISKALIRVNTLDTLDVPKVYLDTDAKNEKDDQHYITYGLFSELDVLAINSIHHGDFGEYENYEEILHIIDLCLDSGLEEDNVPGYLETGNRYAHVFRGATHRLSVSSNGKWYDTRPVVTEASEMIVAAATGSNPLNPVWIVPVGPATNVASAILMAEQMGIELRERLRIMWLGGTDFTEFNFSNDEWSVYVMSRSGLEFNMMPAEVGGTVRARKSRYPDTPIGNYLKLITNDNGHLFDQSCLHAIVSKRLGLGWVLDRQNFLVDPDYSVTIYEDDSTTNTKITDIDEGAMQNDFYDLLNGTIGSIGGQAVENRSLFVENKQVQVLQNDSVTIDLRGSDPGGGMLSYQIAGEPEHGSLMVFFPKIVYTPDPNFVGKDWFSYRVKNHSNSSNQYSLPARVTIEVEQKVSAMVAFKARESKAYLSEEDLEGSREYPATEEMNQDFDALVPLDGKISVDQTIEANRGTEHSATAVPTVSTANSDGRYPAELLDDDGIQLQESGKEETSSPAGAENANSAEAGLQTN